MFTRVVNIVAWFGKTSEFSTFQTARLSILSILLIKLHDNFFGDWSSMKLYIEILSLKLFQPRPNEGGGWEGSWPGISGISNPRLKPASWNEFDLTSLANNRRVNIDCVIQYTLFVAFNPDRWMLFVNSKVMLQNVLQKT